MAPSVTPLACKRDKKESDLKTKVVFAGNEIRAAGTYRLDHELRCQLDGSEEGIWCRLFTIGGYLHHGGGLNWDEQI